MTTGTRAEIDFSTFPDSDGEPMAETVANQIQMMDLIWTLMELFYRQRRTRVAVGGNQLMYYNERDGREHVSPDVYVVLDYAPPPPPKWQTWIEGKFPEIVFEISSESTRQEDVGGRPGDKPALYRRLGVREYYIYDPQGVPAPTLEGYAWDEGRWTEQALLPSGGLWSALLGTELRPLAMRASERRPAGIWLRVLDPQTGEPIPMAEEQVLQAEEQVRQEQRARLAAEERALQAEAALAALLAARDEHTGG